MRWISGLFIGIIFVTAGPVWGASCSVSTSSVKFGQYEALGSTPTTTVGMISLNCSAGLAYNIKADSGQNSTAAFQRRMLATGGSTLKYDLYIDTPMTEVWGDGTGTTFTLTGTGTGGPTQYKVYGRIAGGQRVRAGVYNDSIVVTIEW